MRPRLRHESRHARGKSFALAVMTPIRAGAEGALHAYLRGLPSGAASPLAELPVHYARWVIIDRLPFEGPPRRYREPDRQQLLFTAVFDAPLGAFLDALCRRLPERVDAIWGNCVGYPGPAATHADAVGQWLCDNALETGAFFAPYGDHTVAEVKSSLNRRAQLAKFAVEMQDADPARLHAAFEDTFVRGRGSPR